jgi:hypothetical protein
MPCDAGFCALPSGVSCALCSTPQPCPRCGQTPKLATLGLLLVRSNAVQVAMCGAVCVACRGLERQPQGEATRLFTPAPSQIPGQLAL